MYKNFKLTDEERKQIMEMHESHGYKAPINEYFFDDKDVELIRGNPDFKTKTGRPVGDYLTKRAAAKQFQQDFQKEFPDPAEEPIPFWEKDQPRPSGDPMDDITRLTIKGFDPKYTINTPQQDTKPNFTKKEELDNLEKKITALRLFKDQFGLDDHMTELYNNLLIKYREDSREFFRGGVK